MSGGQFLDMTQLQSVGAETGDMRASSRQTAYNYPVPVRDEPYLSVQEAARALSISPSTLRRYLTDHADHLQLVRARRETRVAVSSIPALARIRDLRRRRVGRREIDHLLGLSPDALGALSVSKATGETPPKSAADQEIGRVLTDMRREIAEMRHERQESEVVMRQTLSSIVFLLDKYNKEVQYYTSEERIANRERDLTIAEQEAHIRRLAGQQARPEGFLSGIATGLRQMLRVLWRSGDRTVAYSPK